MLCNKLCSQAGLLMVCDTEKALLMSHASMFKYFDKVKGPTNRAWVWVVHLHGQTW